MTVKEERREVMNKSEEKIKRGKKKKSLRKSKISKRYSIEGTIRAEYAVENYKQKTRRSFELRVSCTLNQFYAHVSLRRVKAFDGSTKHVEH